MKLRYLIVLACARHDSVHRILRSVIFIDNQYLAVTQNLHTTLLYFQDHNILPIIWVDAVCINQENEQEKEYQIRFMAKIYGKASHIIVWLGETVVDSD